MMYSIKSLIVFFLLLNCWSGVAQVNGSVYFGEPPPGLIPQKFAPGLISLEDRYEFGSVFSKDGREFYFGVEGEGKAEIYWSKLIDDVWLKPKLILPNATFGNNDPMLSPDEQRIYFISSKSYEGDDVIDDYDIWYVERDGEAWSQVPINAGPQINSNKNEYYISFTNDGAMYFGSNKGAEDGKDYNFDIYKSEFVNNKFQAPIKLDENINTNRYEADVFVAPDESYVIFCARRRGGFGSGDLYISFKDKEGHWAPSKNMGSAINSEGNDLCPYVSTDGKYFFYTRDKDIYWVSTEVFQGIKN